MRYFKEPGKKFIFPAIVAILMFIAVFSYYNSKQEALRQLEKAYQERANEDLALLEDSLSGIERDMQQISRNPVVQKTLENRYKTFLEANNDVSSFVEMQFWYLTVSVNSGIDDLEIIAFKDIPRVGNFIYGSSRLNNYHWGKEIKATRSNLIYSEDDKLYMVVPVYKTHTLEMIGVVWVRLNIDYLLQYKSKSASILAWQFSQGYNVLKSGGDLAGEGIVVTAVTHNALFNLRYIVAKPSLLESSLLLLILVISGCAIIIILILYYTAKINRDYEEIIARKQNEDYLQVMVLKAQISPHFLYNIMSMINWKAKYSGQEDISQICLSLADFYRTALNKGQEEISVRDELLNIESYLKLKQHLVEIPFTYSISVAEHCRDLQIINFILQPIVENAIIHGIGSREGDGHIDIEVYTEADDIIMNVKDNGQELVAATDFFENSKGYGVNNVNKRIKLKYGEKYGISLYNDNKGTRVSLRLGKLM